MKSVAGKKDVWVSLLDTLLLQLILRTAENNEWINETYGNYAIIIPPTVETWYFLALYKGN